VCLGLCPYSGQARVCGLINLHLCSSKMVSVLLKIKLVRLTNLHFEFVRVVVVLALLTIVI